MASESGHPEDPRRQIELFLSSQAAETEWPCGSGRRTLVRSTSCRYARRGEEPAAPCQHESPGRVTPGRWEARIRAHEVPQYRNRWARLRNLPKVVVRRCRIRPHQRRGLRSSAPLVQTLGHPGQRLIRTGPNSLPLARLRGWIQWALRGRQRQLFARPRSTCPPVLEAPMP